MDRLAELAVFTGCSSDAVCVTSFRQCAERDNFEAQNIEVVNKFILFNLIIYCREENCVLVGYYEESSVNFIPTFRKNLYHLQGSFDP